MVSFWQPSEFWTRFVIHWSPWNPFRSSSVPEQSDVTFSCIRKKANKWRVQRDHGHQNSYPIHFSSKSATDGEHDDADIVTTQLQLQRSMQIGREPAPET